MSTIVSVEHAVLQEGSRQLIFVRICDSDGVVGYGEATLSGQTEAVRSLITTFADYLCGQQSERINHHWQYLFRGFWKGGFTVMTALAGIEVALWDLLARRMNVPLYQLLGGAVRDRIRVYTHLGGDSSEQIVDNVTRLTEQGWRTLKSFPTLSDTPAAYDQVSKQLERMTVARHANDDIDLCFDCHGRFGFQDALHTARGLAELDFLFIEEPLSPENADQHEAFCLASPVRVATGERLYYVSAFVKLLDTSVAYVQPDPMRAGGITQTRVVADLCGARKVFFAPHNSPGTGPVATAVSLHLAASSHAFMMLEAKERFSNAELDVCSLRLNIDDGHVPLPQGPGLGVELDWQRLTHESVTTMTMPRVTRVDGTVEDY
ncbi:MAG: mandelate racemase/muconate lactonizing enzyme family protein [Deinococcota bacterium]